MWVLPTFGRPARCQEALCSITSASVSSPGLVVIDGDPDPAYSNLLLPPDWRAIYLPFNLGVCGVFNHVLQTWKGERWYGFISDDSIVRTRAFDKPLVTAAGGAGFANSADGWQAHQRMHGAVVFGGDLLRALGWWAPPGLIHCFVDDAWEHIGRALGNWVHLPQVMVEHLHAANAKAVSDTTYHKAYANFESDRSRFEEFVGSELPAAIARAELAVVEARRVAVPPQSGVSANAAPAMGRCEAGAEACPRNLDFANSPPNCSSKYPLDVRA
jgi:hypothetical protein